MNEIDSLQRDQVQWALDHGLGLRGAQRKFGIHRDTVKRWFCIIKGLPLPKWHGKEAGTSKKKLATPEYAPVAPNTCGCGCGAPTTVLQYDDPKTGKKAGQYRNWAAGHYTMAAARMKGPNHIPQSQRHKALNVLRKKMLDELHRDRFQTRDDLFVKFSKEGYSNVTLGIVLKYGCEDLSYRVNPDELPVPGRKKKPKVETEEFVLRVIPHERETEIPLLVDKKFVASLDAPIGDGDTDRHDLIGHSSWGHAVEHLDPLEALIAKEEAELAENQGLKHDREKLRQWEEANKPLTQFPDIKLPDLAAEARGRKSAAKQAKNSAKQFQLINTASELCKL